MAERAYIGHLDVLDHRLHLGGRIKSHLVPARTKKTSQCHCHEANTIIQWAGRQWWQRRAIKNRGANDLAQIDLWLRHAHVKERHLAISDEPCTFCERVLLGHLAGFGNIEATQSMLIQVCKTREQWGELCARCGRLIKVVAGGLAEILRDDDAVVIVAKDLVLRKAIHLSTSHLQEARRIGGPHTHVVDLNRLVDLTERYVELAQHDVLMVNWVGIELLEQLERARAQSASSG